MSRPILVFTIVLAWSCVSHAALPAFAQDSWEQLRACSACGGCGNSGGCGGCGDCGGCGGCGGGMCGLSQTCVSETTYHPTYYPPVKCQTDSIVQTILGNGLSLDTACMRPELTVNASTTAITITSADGCPDHPYFQDVRAADKHSCRPGYGTADCGSAMKGHACGGCGACGACGADKCGACGADKCGACGADKCGACGGCGADVKQYGIPDACGVMTCGGAPMSLKDMIMKPFRAVSYMKCPASRSACTISSNGSAYGSTHGAPACCASGYYGCDARCSACDAKCGGGECRANCSACAAKCSAATSCTAKVEACGCGSKKCGECGSSVGKYTPIKTTYTFTIPSRAVLGTSSSSLPIVWEGVMGVAVNGVPFVGTHVDAVSGKAAAMTMTFDSCGGHGGSDHKYHYHIPPICLLKSLGGTTPTRSDWWLAKHPESQWPEMSVGASPLVGWAMDGFPIFAPYDPITKKLQVSSSSGCVSELDSCNGKTLSNGQYAYFITPTYPYVPTCLRGSNMGRMVETQMEVVTDNVCVMRGYAPMDVHVRKDCVTHPQSLYHTVPKSTKWVVQTVVIGIIMALLTLASTACFAKLPRTGDAGYFQSAMRMLIAVVLAALSRALFLLIDPYFMSGFMPRIINELLYGIFYPLVNVCTVETLYLLGFFNEKALAFKATWFLVIAEFIVQAVMDGLRAYGKQPAWHWICQCLYVIWGGCMLLVSIGLALKQARFASVVASFFAFVLVIMSIVLLSVSIGGPSSAKYFSTSTWLRCLEVLVVGSYLGVLLEYISKPPQSDKQKNLPNVFGAKAADPPHHVQPTPPPPPPPLSTPSSDGPSAPVATGIVTGAHMFAPQPYDAQATYHQPWLASGPNTPLQSHRGPIPNMAPAYAPQAHVPSLSPSAHNSAQMYAYVGHPYVPGMPQAPPHPQPPQPPSQPASVRY